MRKAEFKAWLINNTNGSKNIKVITDTIARVSRVEREYRKKDNTFSLEAEYRKDKGESIIKDFSKYARGLEGRGFDLPIGTNQICAISAAVKKYFEFEKASGEE